MCIGGCHTLPRVAGVGVERSGTEPSEVLPGRWVLGVGRWGRRALTTGTRGGMGGVDAGLEPAGGGR